jgi:hypothetical protein
MTYDEYQNKRSWLIDTAETAADQKRLKAQLAKLKAQYDAGKAKAKAKASPSPKPLTGAAAIKAIQERTSPKGVAAAEAQARAAIAQKYPGLTIPEVKKASDLSRSRNKNFTR